jgi:hypothetical protein
MDSNRFKALHVIETLRAGVPSRRISALFTSGRESLLDGVRRDLDSLKQGSPVKGLVVRAEYGDGKTHFLNQVFNEAHEQGFAVSLIVLSKETPFHNLRRVFQRAAANVWLPGAEQPGFEKPLFQLRPNSDKVSDLLHFADAELHPKLYHVLRNFFEEQDSYKRFILYNDLHGNFIRMSDLRAIHRLNFHAALSMPRFIIALHLPHYFKLLARLFCALGHNGWVILFDESELIGKLGYISRGKAYANMAHLLGLKKESLPGVYGVYAFASSFFVDVLQEKNDAELIPQRLEDRGQPDLAADARQVIGYLTEKSKELPSLSDRALRDILGKIGETHGTALGWSPNLDMKEILSIKNARLRTKIRAALESLDIQFLYRQPVEGIQVGKLEEVCTIEDEAFYETTGDDDTAE